MVSDFISVGYSTLCIAICLVVLRGTQASFALCRPFVMPHSMMTRCNVNFELGFVVIPLPTRPCLK